ncbi:MAG: ferric reductase-like transmembrane domain-containing protein [Thermosynechococcaceae cyanobacterium]
MRRQVLIYLGIFICFYIAAMGMALLSQPTLFSNILGLFSVGFYICSLLPGLFSSVLPSLRKQKLIILFLKHRRFLGVSAFMLALNHGALQFVKRNISLLEPSTYLHYFQGLSMMVIMTILAITSSDESVKDLKKNWKKLHRLTYLIIIFLPWHIIDKMSGRWSFLTPISILLSTMMLVFFSMRFYKERCRLLI